MRFDQRPNRRNDDDRILPLINVVFLLLIFFMIAGRLSASDPFQIDPPRSASQENPKIQDIVIQIGAGNETALDGDLVNDATLTARVSSRLAQAEGTKIRLKADADTDANRVIQIMELLHAAGAKKVNLLTLKEGG